MDYATGTHLTKWQWDLIHDPGVVVRAFERDGDGMIKGAFYDGIAFIPLVEYKYRYNFGDIFSVESRSSEIEYGGYTLTPHFNETKDNSKKLSCYVAWSTIGNNPPTNRLDCYVEKLRTMMDEARLNTLAVMMMEVPCCSGLLRLVQTALASASRKIPVKQVIVSLRGEILREEWL